MPLRYEWLPSLLLSRSFLISMLTIWIPSLLVQNAQLGLLQRIEDLEVDMQHIIESVHNTHAKYIYQYIYCVPQGEKHQLQVQLTQLDEHTRTQMAKTEVELKVLSSRLTDYDVSVLYQCGGLM